MEQRSVWVGAQYGCGCMHGFVGWMDGVSEHGVDVCVDRCGSLGVGVQAKIAKRGQGLGASIQKHPGATLQIKAPYRAWELGM